MIRILKPKNKNIEIIHAKLEKRKSDWFIWKWKLGSHFLN